MSTQLQEFSSEHNHSMDTSIDLLANTYMKAVTDAVDRNDYDDARAIFDEFVVDGVDPQEEQNEYEWLFVDDFTD